MKEHEAKSSNENGGTRGRVKEKVFILQNSPLINRYETSEDIKTIYNLFAIILITLMANTVIHDYTKTGSLHFGLRLILAGFNKFHFMILLWCTLFGLSSLAFFLFKVWAVIRSKIPPKSSQRWDRIWLVLLILYYFATLIAVQIVVQTLGFEAGSAAILLLEMTRLLMKQHSFIRTNVPKVRNYKPHSEQTLILPSIKQYVYFSFAPTLIYRDEYPRTKSVRWKFVAYNLMEVLAIVFLLSLVVERFLIPPFEEFGLRKYTKSEVLIPVLGNSFPGVLFMLCAFYSVLHSAQNAFAELLTFGDRGFYGEWWLSKSLSEFYRTWNIVVHDWLYTYVYKDMYEIVCPGNKGMAKLTVFLLSAVMHEWIITNGLGLFFPIQFAQFFLAGALLTLLNLLHFPVGNLTVWYAIIFGAGVQTNLYALEFIARRNCPISTNQTIFDFFTPRFLTCDCIQ